MEKNIKIKLTPNQIDEKVESILRMKEIKAQLEKDIKEAQIILESQYTQPINVKEYLVGNRYRVEKRPRDLGKNDLDYNKAAELLTTEELKLVKKEVIDLDKLKAFIKAKAIDKCLIPMIKTEKWTFSTNYEHIEVKENTVTIEMKKTKAQN